MYLYKELLLFRGHLCAINSTSSYIMARVYSSILLVLSLLGLSSAATIDQTGLTTAEIAKAVVKMCASETGLDLSEFSTFLDKGTFPDDKSCYFKCLLQSVRAMDNDGNFEKSNLDRFAPEERRASVDQCVTDSNKESDQCKKSLVFHSCVRDSQKDWYTSAMKKAMAD